MLEGHALQLHFAAKPARGLVHMGLAISVVTEHGGSDHVSGIFGFAAVKRRLPQVAQSRSAAASFQADCQRHSIV